MTRRHNRDTALLALELETPTTSADAMGYSVKLAVTTTPELPWYEARRTFNEYAVANDGCLRDLYLSKSQPVVFELDRKLADRPLTLHVLQRDYSQSDEAWLELASVAIDPISLGGERTLPKLILPQGRSSGGQTPTAAGFSETERR